MFGPNYSKMIGRQLKPPGDTPYSGLYVDAPPVKGYPFQAGGI